MAAHRASKSRGQNGENWQHGMAAAGMRRGINKASAENQRKCWHGNQPVAAGYLAKKAVSTKIIVMAHQRKCESS